LGQIRNGLVVGLVGSVIIFVSSWLVTTVVFPNYFAEMAEGYREAYVSMGLPQDEVADLVVATAASSPIRSAFDGVVGTMVTSLVVAAIAGGGSGRRPEADCGTGSTRRRFAASPLHRSSTLLGRCSPFSWWR
jgi:hypothetical protein